MNFDVVLGRTLRLVVPAVAVAMLVLAVLAVLDRMAVAERAAERRALTQRAIALTAGALSPGSALACLDAGAGDAAEAACEAAVFASPQSTAAAVAYVGARLALLGEAQAVNADGFAETRRALELDRYGIAAHVLAARSGCTPERCAAFALFADAGTLKTNMTARAYDQYVARHAVAWNAAPAALPASAAQSQAPAQTTPPDPAMADSKSGEQVAHPLSGKYDFPSAASIPPVSIMGVEPTLPKAAAAAQAAEFKADPRFEPKPAPEAPAKTEDVPVPPKRPQALREQPAPPIQLR